MVVSLVVAWSLMCNILRLHFLELEKILNQSATNNFISSEYPFPVGVVHFC